MAVVEATETILDRKKNAKERVSAEELEVEVKTDHVQAD